MDFCILGPMEVRDGEHTVALGGAKQRALLALLLLHANEPVSMDHLTDALWPESAPEEGIKSLQVSVSRLRRALGTDGVLVTRAPGYQLLLEAGQLDAARFERSVDEGGGRSRGAMRIRRRGRCTRGSRCGAAPR